MFSASHALPLRLLREGTADGLRVDHVDGLRDPGAYLDRLRGEAGEGAWLVVEKILAAGEALPPWPVAGTTGYEFAAAVTGLFVDPAAEEALAVTEAGITGCSTDPATAAARGKADVLPALFAAEVSRLQRCAEAAVVTGVAAALPDLVERFPRYRCYPAAESPVPAYAEFLARLQQLTAATTAKGVEDTAFYRALRLLALNEVGATPGCFGTGIPQFHELMARAAREHPEALLATATHDTKRGEDARVRLALLSQVAPAWDAAVKDWDSRARSHLREGVPDGHARYLLWQTLVGAYPVDGDRLSAFMLKALREAKLQTSWLAPDEGYEAAVDAFTRSVLADGGIMTEVQRFVAAISPGARELSIAQLLLKLTCPGVPDVYQGTELEDLSLVDPDNRRLVDYSLRQRLATAKQSEAADAPKLRLIRGALALRRERPTAFGPGSMYTPLDVAGADDVLAFARGDAADPLSVVVSVRCFPAQAGDASEARVARISLDGSRWRNLLAGVECEGPEVTVVGPALLVRAA